MARRLAALVTGLAALLAVLSGPARGATDQPAEHLGQAVTVHRHLRHWPVTWSTCTPLGAKVTGPYRVYNDDWFGRECIRATGWGGFRVTTAARPSGLGVVAYPDIQYGCAWSYCTPGTRPVRLARMGHLLFSATATGHARGAWIADLDSWFFPTRDTTGHGTAEMIIVLRYMPGMARGHLVRIGHRWWWLRSAETCNSGLCWPLIRFFAAHRLHSVRRLPFRTFIRVAEHHHMLARSDWWGSTAFGFELWSGGRGLHASLAVTR